MTATHHGLARRVLEGNYGCNEGTRILAAVIVEWVEARTAYEDTLFGRSDDAHDAAFDRRIAAEAALNDLATKPQENA